MSFKNLNEQFREKKISEKELANKINDFTTNLQIKKYSQ